MPGTSSDRDGTVTHPTSALWSPPLTDYLRSHAWHTPDKVAVVDGATHESLTYRDLIGQIEARGDALRRAGVRAGDRVGILSANSLPYVVLLLALADMGAIAVPLNTRLHPQEMADNLVDAGAAALVTSVDLAPAATAVADLAGVTGRLVLAGAAPGWSPLVPLTQGEGPGEGPGATAGRAVSGTDVATLLYTSGTTGRAKGCMLMQQSWTGYAQNMTVALRMSADDTYLAFLPYFHVAGLGLMLSALVLGGRVVTQAAADPGQMHAAIRRYGVTVVMVVPGISGPFATHPDAVHGHDSTLRLVVSGAGLEHASVIDAVSTRLGVEYIGIYGQTESGTKVSWATAEQIASAPGTYGRVMPSLAYRLVDGDDHDVPAGVPGELVLRGGTIMRGYWGNPQATEQTLRGGWHHTGDVFVQDEDGLLRMVDRTKYLIKSGGENVYPQEVENLLKSHPDVADVAVAGVPDAQWGETVKAFVVPGPDGPPSRAALDEFVRTSLAGYKAPRYIEFVDAIPRNVSGKILKHELAARPTDDAQRVRKAGS